MNETRKSQKKVSVRRAVNFVYEDAPGKEVFLSGSFNNWQLITRMKDKQQKGFYSCRLLLEPGEYQNDYVAIHRVAISVSRRGSGISTAIINYAAEHAKKLGRASLRIDTHEGNVVMRRMLEKHGFALCGIIYLQNGDSRVAYEKNIF